MKLLLAGVAFALITIAAPIRAEAYATEATITLNKQTKQFQTFATVTKLTGNGSSPKEEIIAHPRIISSKGAPATMYIGSAPGAKNYRREENITMDVTWPENSDAVATCTITVRRGDKLLSKSTTKFTVQEK